MAKILVIDDEPSIRETILVNLRKNGFETLSAVNGAEGIKIARAEMPDVIICDVRMELVSGYEMLAVIRNDPMTTGTPFILITAEPGRSAMRQGMELGADDYLTKPFTAAEIIAAVNSQLQKRHVLMQQAEQRLNELRAQLSTSIPHELRTPLNGILGYADILRKQYGELEPTEVAQMSERIYKNAKRLNRLVENFLIYAQLEILETDVSKIASLKRNCAEDVAMIVDSVATQKTYESARSFDLDLHVETANLAISPDYFTKIFEEVFDNALRYSKKGSRIHVHAQPDGQKYVLTVTDHGRGMTPHQIAEIGAYKQFERKIYEQQGSGLGLSVAKKLVEVHGGSMTVESEHGKRTTVVITLPLAPKEQHPA
ncbi:MAG TPA: HAMP domain-containing sensor histidine kinase [Bacteroidota bacterium]